MNYLWAGMMLTAVVCGAFGGTLPEVAQAALDSAKESVTLCLTMLGMLSFWMGMMRIGSASGLIRRMTEGIRPALRRIFPDIPEGHPALEQIAANCIANVLGLGWAATPAGLKAMEELKNLEEDRCRGRIPGPGVPPGTASDEMCTFLVVNISSLQLIPVNIIAYRSQYGSMDPTAIVGPAIAATCVSTAVGILFCRIMCRKGRG